MFVELQPLSAIDFRVRQAESFTRGIEVDLVLFNESTLGFLHERIGIIVVAAFDLLSNALSNSGVRVTFITYSQF